MDIIEETASLYGIFEAQAHGHAEGILVKMTCYQAAFQGKIKADNEIEEIRWLTTEDMDIISPVDQLIFRKLHEDRLLA